MKKNKVLTLFLLLVLSLMMPKNLKSQIVEVGVSGGLSYYIGDINFGKHFSQSEISYAGTLRYYQNLRWAFRFQYSKYNLTSSDKVAAYIPDRGLEISSEIDDISFITEFNFFEYWTGSKRDRVTPYIFAGISLFKFNTTDFDGKALQSEKNSWSIPFGLGVKYSLNKRIGATLEWQIHKAFTDEIDGVVDNMIGDKPIVFGYKCDWYNMLGLTISYRFNLPKNEVCHSM